MCVCVVLCVFFFNYWNIFQYYFEKGPEQLIFIATCHRPRDPLFRLGRPLRLSGFHFLLMLKVLISLHPFIVIKNADTLFPTQQVIVLIYHEIYSIIHFPIKKDQGLPSFVEDADRSLYFKILQ